MPSRGSEFLRDARRLAVKYDEAHRDHDEDDRQGNEDQRVGPERLGDARMARVDERVARLLDERRDRVALEHLRELRVALSDYELDRIEDRRRVEEHLQDDVPYRLDVAEAH